MKKFSFNNTHADKDENEKPGEVFDYSFVEEPSTDNSKNFFTDTDYLEYFRNHKKGICIGLISIFATLLLCIAGNLTTVCKYNKAEDALNNSSYDEAIELYESIANYKDSNEKLREAKYRKADALVQKGEYDEAITLYRALAVYKDSADKVRDVTYQKGKNLLERKMFVDAISIFTNLGDYKDSKEILKEANYQYAYRLVEKRQFLDAINTFNSLGEYKDSKSMITECNYLQGSVYINNKEYEKAINLYERLGDYKDAKKILNNFQYVVTKETTSYANNNTKTTMYSYNESGKLEKIYSDGEYTNYEYDTNGNLIKKTSSSRVTTYFYNNNILTKSETVSNGKQFITKYDKNGNPTEEDILYSDGSYEKYIYSDKKESSSSGYNKEEYEYHYSTNGNITFMRYSSIHYNKYGDPDFEQRTVYNSTKPTIYTFRHEYVYTSAGKILEEEMYSGNRIQYWRQYKYDSHGNEIECISKKSKNGVLYSKTQSVYDYIYVKPQ